VSKGQEDNAENKTAEEGQAEDETKEEILDDMLIPCIHIVYQIFTPMMIEVSDTSGDAFAFLACHDWGPTWWKVHSGEDG